jgi:hypothetical protein
MYHYTKGKSKTISPLGAGRSPEEGDHCSLIELVLNTVDSERLAKNENIQLYLDHYYKCPKSCTIQYSTGVLYST